MRNRLLILGLLFLCFAGCYPDDFNNVEWGPEPTLEFSEPGVTLQPTAGSSDTIIVNTNYKEWSVEVDEASRSWCKVVRDNEKLIISVEENTGDKERSAVVNVTVGKGKLLSKEIAVTQLGKAPKIVLTPNMVDFPLEGGNSNVQVVSNVSGWEPNVVVGSSWCSVRKEGTKLVVTALRNDNKEMREAVVTVADASTSAMATLKVVQLGTDKVLTVSPISIFGSKGGVQNLKVITNHASWEATVPSSAAWCQAIPSDKTLQVRVDSNGLNNGRQCDVLITAGSGKNLLRYVLKVVQVGDEPELTLEKAELRFDADANIQTVGVFTNLSTWKAECGAAWCKLLKSDDILTVSVESNESETEIRETVVEVTADGLRQELKVVQLPDITLVMSVDSIRMDTKGGMESVIVQTNQSEWNAHVMDSVSWCTVEVAGNQLNVRVDENISTTRVAEVEVIAGSGEAVKSQILRIYQEGLGSDRDILMAFYNATGGDNWTRKDNWGSDRPLHEWYGVTTETIEPLSKAGEPMERVVEIKIGENNLVGTLPAEMGGLTFLRRLQIYGNPDLTGEIPVEWFNLTELRVLELSNNQLSGRIPAELGKLKKLESLNLYGNKFSGEIPAELWSLVKIFDLTLGGNELTGTLPADVGNLTDLTFLNLNSNQLSGEIPVELGNLIRLRSLSMHSNKFSGPIPEELCNLVNLEYLDWDHNQLSGELPLKIENMISLNELYLQVNQLSGQIPVELGKLSNLEHINLSENQFVGDIPVELGNLTKLERLMLRMNYLTGVPESLAQLPGWGGFEPDFNIFPQKQGTIGFIKPEPQGSYQVSLLFKGDAKEVNQAAGGHLYGVQVLSRAAGTVDDYMPYGYGLYDDSARVVLELPGDREYTVYTTLVADGKTKVQTSGNWYALPFEVSDYVPMGRGVTPLPDYEEQLPVGGAAVNGFVTDGVKTLNGIHRGATVLAADGKRYDRPNTARYFGERLNYTPAGNEVLEINMSRALFAVTCEVDSLREGRIRVEIEGAPAMYIDARNAEHSVSGVFAFANANGGWTDSGYSEMLNVKFIWEKTNGLERELSSERVEFKRSTATKLHTVFKDDGMSMNIENKPLEDGEVIDIEGIIW